MAEESIFLKICNSLLTILLTLLIFPFLFIIVMFPFFWRLFACMIAGEFKSKTILRPLSLTSLIFAVDDLYKSPRANVCGMMRIDGCLELEQTLNRIESTLMSKKWPELQCCVVRWWGTYFFKRIPNFSLREYVTTNNAVGHDAIEDEIAILVDKPWTEGSPLWEFILFPYYQENQSMLVLRYHHALLDGYSALHLFRALNDSNPVQEAEAVKTLQAILKKHSPHPIAAPFINLFLMIISPFYAMHTTRKYYGLSAWIPASVPVSHSMVRASTQMKMDTIKPISKKTGVSISVLLAEGFTSAIRQHLIDLGPKGVGVSRDFATTYSMPRPNHPGTLTNHFAAEVLRLPISEPNPVKRLAEMKETFKTIISTQFHQSSVLTACMAGLVASISGNPVGTVPSGISTNMVVFGGTQYMCGLKIDAMEMRTGPLNPTNVVVYSTVSYDGIMEINVAADKVFIQDKMTCQKFVQNIVKAVEAFGEDAQLASIV